MARDVLLPNTEGRVTFHYLDRLELRNCPQGFGQSIVPVYQCWETSGERQYGYLNPDLSRSELKALFGPLVEDPYPPKGCVWSLLADWMATSKKAA